MSSGINNKVLKLISQDYTSKSTVFSLVVNCAVFSNIFEIIKYMHSELLQTNSNLLTEEQMTEEILSRLAGSDKSKDVVFIYIFNFELLFKLNNKFIYSFLEMFESAKRLVVLAFTADFDFKKFADPRIASRFPNKTIFFDDIHYDGMIDFWKRTLIKSYSFVANDNRLNNLVEAAKRCGYSFEKFLVEARKLAADWLFAVNFKFADTQLSKIDEEAKGHLEKSLKKEIIKENEDRDLSKKERNMRLSSDYLNFLLLEFFTKVDIEEKLEEKLGSTWPFKATNCCYPSESRINSWSKKIEDIMMVFETKGAFKRHRWTYLQLKLCHFVLIYSFFAARSRMGGRITFESIYIEFVSNLSQDGVLKLTPYCVLNLLKELVCTNILFKVSDKGKTYYEVNGSIHYLQPMFDKVVEKCKLSNLLGQKLQKIYLGFY